MDFLKLNLQPLPRNDSDGNPGGCGDPGASARAWQAALRGEAPTASVDAAESWFKSLKATSEAEEQRRFEHLSQAAIKFAAQELAEQAAEAEAARVAAEDADE
jgi:hypothetical protein